MDEKEEEEETFVFSEEESREFNELPQGAFQRISLFLEAPDLFRFLQIFNNHSTLKEIVSYRSDLGKLAGKSKISKMWRQFSESDLYPLLTNINMEIKMEAPYLPYLKTITKIILEEYGFKSCALRTIGFLGGNDSCIISLKCRIDSTTIAISKEGRVFLKKVNHDFCDKYGIDRFKIVFILNGKDLVNKLIRTIVGVAFDICIRNNWMKKHQKKDGSFHSAKALPFKYIKKREYYPYFDPESGKIIDPSCEEKKYERFPTFESIIRRGSSPRMKNFNNMTVSEYERMKPIIRPFNEIVEEEDFEDFTDGVYEIKEVNVLFEKDYNLEDKNFLIHESPEDLVYPPYVDKRNSSFGETAVAVDFVLEEKDSEVIKSIHSSTTTSSHHSGIFGTATHQEAIDVLERERNYDLEEKYMGKVKECNEEKKRRKEAEEKFKKKNEELECKLEKAEEELKKLRKLFFGKGKKKDDQEEEEEEEEEEEDCKEDDDDEQEGKE